MCAQVCMQSSPWWAMMLEAISKHKRGEMERFPHWDHSQMCVWLCVCMCVQVRVPSPMCMSLIEEKQQCWGSMRRRSPTGLLVCSALNRSDTITHHPPLWCITLHRCCTDAACLWNKWFVRASYVFSFHIFLSGSLAVFRNCSVWCNPISYRCFPIKVWKPQCERWWKKRNNWGR